MNVRLGLKTHFDHHLSTARMYRKNYLLLNRVESAQNARKLRDVVGILTTVYGRHQVSMLTQSKPVYSPSLVRVGTLLRPIQYVKHDIPYKMDVLQDALICQIANRRVTR